MLILAKPTITNSWKDLYMSEGFKSSKWLEKTHINLFFLSFYHFLFFFSRFVMMLSLNQVFKEAIGTN